MASSAEPLERTRRLPYAQLLFALAVAIVLGFGRTIDPSALTPVASSAAAAIVGLTVAQLVVWRMPRLGDGLWLAVIPLLDLLCCAPIRAGLVGVLPAVGIIVAFPMVWLAFSFPWPLAVAGVCGVFFVTAYPFIAAGQPPQSFAQWAVVLTLPIMVTLLGALSFAVARQLSRTQTALTSASGRMREAVRSTAANAATMRAITDTTADAIAMFDREGRPLLVNSLARELAEHGGVTTELRPMAEAADVFDVDRTTRIDIGPEIVQLALADEFDGPRQVWVGPAGRQRAISFLARPVRDSEGEVLGAIVVGHDVTALVEAVEVRDHFLDTVGHELKTPLTTILGHAALLSAETGAVARSGAAIERAGERLLGVVNQLLAASRSDFAEAVLEPVPLAPIVEGARARFAGEAAAKGVGLAVVDDEARWAMADARDLAQIVEVLVSNAVAFTPPGGSVTVLVRDVGDDVEVEVRDTGVGMTPDELRQAADPFYRSPYAEEQAIPGLGLGLTLATRLAASNGGELRLEPAAIGTRAMLRVRSA
ncbi:ATP-binding protein [Herbiconiux sp. 11R-BC]|uniref:sensor histidine kinase n=1 Tax=Herbiconiux sp. 11R-BC TaxID=3111637 RepID=UPI003C0DC6D9